MNYYIQGCAANADKIKAAFEDKGIYSTCNFANENYLYYQCDGKVAFCFIGGGLANIIKTHPDYKELELPVEPKFKVGDKVIYNGKQHTVTSVNDKYYGFSGGVAGCLIKLQDQLLSPAPKPHYDIANFHAGIEVLVRDGDDEEWNYLHFSHYRKKLSDHFFAGGNPWFQCIPFNNDTKHLLGTTDMPSEEYINW